MRGIVKVIIGLFLALGVAWGKSYLEYKFSVMHPWISNPLTTTTGIVFFLGIFILIVGMIDIFVNGGD